MKTLFTAFSNFMDRLGESDHFLRCAWIFMCVTINVALGGLIGKGIGEILKVIGPSPTVVHTSMLYCMVGMGGIVLLVMLANYRNLWELTGPNVARVQSPSTAPAYQDMAALTQLEMQQLPVD